MVRGYWRATLPPTKQREWLDVTEREGLGRTLCFTGVCIGWWFIGVVHFKG